MGKNRNTSDYLRRQIKTRETRKRFLIVCEGEKTEVNYFKAFTVPKKIEFMVKGEGKNSLSLVNKAIKMIDNLKKDDSFDQIWCVFDKDNCSKEQFNQAEGLAKQKNIKIAYSNEAFEIWFILHFQYLDIATSRSEYLTILTKQMQKYGLLNKKEKYAKNREDMYEKLKPYQTTAITNAAKLIQDRDEAKKHPFDANPSTTVQELVQELNINSRP
ncbi:MAG: RloB family protein [Microcystis sp. LE17-20A]|uniref:RloB family protein n=1 Tax=unclassified Microcystis TaxID=2643300 RepID=UPI0022C6A1B0|nr:MULTISPECIES: RloB family protein [unclassified Microcystis]MCZ8036729.1 RloB family protein [Microcystis sp. LE17-20A]MCZ8213940.1 RloB family protein [Microcystis sp. LE19-8.1F]